MVSAFAHAEYELLIHSLYALLGPLQVLLHFFGCPHAVREIGSRTRQTALSEGL
jgi:hypothetical protein